MPNGQRLPRRFRDWERRDQLIGVVGLGIGLVPTLLLVFLPFVELAGVNLDDAELLGSSAAFLAALWLGGSALATGLLIRRRHR